MNDLEQAPSWTRSSSLVIAGAMLALTGVGTALWQHEGPQRAKLASAGQQMVRVTDETGRAVAIPQPVRRIVSLAPSLTETLFALGLGDRVVGDTDFCDYPPEARTKAHVGGTDTPNLEKIAQLRPDLVLATRSGGNRLSTVQSLDNLGLAVFATDPHSVDEVIASTERIAEITGAGEQGRSFAAALRGRMEGLSTKLAGVRPTKVFMVVWQQPLITVGRNTFIADAVRKAGAENMIETGEDWPNVSLEEVVRLQPEYLIFASEHSGESDRQIADLARSPGWRSLEALRNRRVIVLSETIARPAPRLVDTIEQLARTLHPERFDPAQVNP